MTNQCTMCTFYNTILLYSKLPCICYRGIIKFHCIFAGFWSFNMPQILKMIQGNNWGKITNFWVWDSRKLKFPHVTQCYTMLHNVTEFKIVAEHSDQSKRAKDLEHFANYDRFNANDNPWFQKLNLKYLATNWVVNA